MVLKLVGFIPMKKTKFENDVKMYGTQAVMGDEHTFDCV